MEFADRMPMIFGDPPLRIAALWTLPASIFGQEMLLLVYNGAPYEPLVGERIVAIAMSMN